jgi:hypothetical protein
MSDQEDHGQDNASATSDPEPANDEKPFIVKPIESAPIMKQLDPEKGAFFTRIVQPDEKADKTADRPPDSDQAGTSDE